MGGLAEVRQTGLPSTGRAIADSVRLRVAPLPQVFQIR